MSWIPWQSTFMRWLTADSMRITIFGTLILCVIGCVLAALFGRWSRQSQIPRLLRASLSAILLSWIFFVGYGGVGLFPSVFVFLIAAKSGEPAKAYEVFVFAVFIACFFAVFASFWFSSRTNPKDTKL